MRHAGMVATAGRTPRQGQGSLAVGSTMQQPPRCAMLLPPQKPTSATHPKTAATEPQGTCGHNCTFVALQQGMHTPAFSKSHTCPGPLAQAASAHPGVGRKAGGELGRVALPAHRPLPLPLLQLQQPLRLHQAGGVQLQGRNRWGLVGRERERKGVEWRVD